MNSKQHKKKKTNMCLRRLPMDLLGVVVDQLSSEQTMVTLSLTSKQMNEVVHESRKKHIFHFRNDIWSSKQLRVMVDTLTQINKEWPMNIFNITIRYNITNEDVVAIGKLSNVGYLTIVGSEKLTDVRPLAHIRRLSIWECENVSDIDALGSCCELTLNSLPKVKTVKGLTSVNTLTIAACWNISDFHRINGRVPNLRIHMCKQVSDIGVFSEARDLVLYQMFNVTDVSALSQVKKLHLSRCHNITDVSPLINVEKLIICDCIGISDISPLKNNKHLELCEFDALDVSALGNVESLTLLDCEAVVGIDVVKKTVKNFVVDNCGIGVREGLSIRALYIIPK